MKRAYCLSWLAIAAALAAVCGGDALAKAHRSDSAQRLRLGPRFAAGDVLRYRLASTTTTVAHRSGIVNDPQGPSKLTLSWNAVVRMEVLASARDASGQTDSVVRIRTTYEKSSATTNSDAYDPDSDGIEAEYRNLEGHSFEFTIDGSGRATNVQGFENNKQASAATQGWVGQLATGASAPHDGIVVGQTWSSEQPVPASPLAGLIWRSRSEYARDEACKPASAQQPDPLSKETCAVLTTQLELAGSKGPGHDATPESYRKQNARTSGSWTGHGTSLSYVSVSTGRLVSVTQSSSEQMDFTVKSAEGPQSIRYQGSVQSRTQLELIESSSK